MNLGGRFPQSADDFFCDGCLRKVRKDRAERKFDENVVTPKKKKRPQEEPPQEPRKRSQPAGEVEVDESMMQEVANQVLEEADDMEEVASIEHQCADGYKSRIFRLFDHGGTHLEIACAECDESVWVMDITDMQEVEDAEGEE